MPDYLPLCASRQDLLPTACRSCTWWQTPINGQHRAEAAAEKRRAWMIAVESTWGSPGLLRERVDTAARSNLQPARTPKGQGDLSASWQDPATTASIHYAPAVAVPRLGSLPFAPPDRDAVLVFCLRSEEVHATAQAKRILHQALGQLKRRGLQEAYAFAGLVGSPEDQGRCQFFSLDFLESNGFHHVMDNGDIYLMRADLRGLLSLIGQLESMVGRVLRHEPTPSPAAWTHRGAS
jgi:hypothetical protein